jgi:hypothetical protein
MKAMPAQMAKTFGQMVDDEELESLASCLGLIDTRICELLGQLDKTGMPSQEKLIAAFVAHEKAVTESAKKRSLKKLGDMIFEGEQARFNNQAIHRELLKLYQTRTETALVETKRRKDLGGYIKLEIVMATYKAVLEAIKKKVPDVVQCREVLEEVMRLMPFNPANQVRQIEQIEVEEEARS